MKVTDKFHKGTTLFSLELLPPLRGHDINSVFVTTDRLARYNPSYINITYHGSQIETITLPDGTKANRLVRKRAGTIGVAAALTSRYGIDVVPHLVCSGFSKYDNENTLIDLSFLGIDNVLALRGDASGPESQYQKAEELVSQIAGMNHGQYLGYDSGDSTDFCIGVAGYPEGHILGNKQIDIENINAKISSGAHYIVTQMFFDNAHYFRFVDLCRAAGITAPIVAGIKPFSTINQLRLLPETFGVELPKDLTREVVKRPEHVREIGIEWAIAQGKELIQAGVPALHFYTMGKADNVEQIVKQLF